jgi:hypothetical protein
VAFLLDLTPYIRSLLSSCFSGLLRLLLIEANKPVAPLLIEAPLDPLE